MVTKPEVTVGLHRMVFEADDIIICHYGPVIGEKEIQALIELQREHVKGKPYFLLIDLSRCGIPSAPVRRVIGQSTTRVTLRGVAMYGGGLHIRAVARLLNTALALFGKNPFPQEFFGSREAALAWLYELRGQQAAANP